MLLEMVLRLDDIEPLYDETLCGNEFTCTAVFQMLPPLEQQFVLRMVLGVPASESWAPERFSRVSEMLRRLRLPHPGFSALLRRALVMPEPWDIEQVPGPERSQLLQWMTWRWNTVLIYIIGEDLDERFEPHNRVVTLLENAGLVEDEITGAGLEFLLKPRHEQVWQLVKQLQGAEICALLLTLSFCTFGRGYSVAALTDQQRKALLVLGGLGLVYQKSKKAERFYPTLLGIKLGKSVKEDKITVIVQTNFQVIAYTDANTDTATLVVGMLSLFASLRLRLPNLVVGDISRGSVKSCVHRGINIDQIARFLYAHSPNIVPANVLDQMRLWASEDDRVSFQHGVLVHCPTAPLFDQARAIVLEHNWLIWDSPPLTLFVDAAAESHLRAFL